MRVNGGSTPRFVARCGLPLQRMPPPYAAGRRRGPRALVPTPGARPSRAAGSGFDTGDALHQRGDLESSRRPGAPPPPCASGGGALAIQERLRSGPREQRADAQGSAGDLLHTAVAGVVNGLNVGGAPAFTLTPALALAGRGSDSRAPQAAVRLSTFDETGCPLPQRLAPGLCIVMAPNGHFTAHRLQPVQRWASCSTEVFFHCTVSRLSSAGAHVGTHQPQPVQRSGSITGSRADDRGVRALGGGAGGSVMRDSVAHRRCPGEDPGRHQRLRRRVASSHRRGGR